jgi:D-alanyl-D-alanine carboxypeptidase
MGSRCVSIRHGHIPVLVCVAGIAASFLVTLSSPAEAKRRKRTGSYNPPYAAMVVDAKTGRTLHAQNEDALRHPASVTKVMTLYLLFEQLERGKVSLATPLRVSANASRQAPSKLGLDPGETIEVENAIKALVTKSANDVAVVVAENLAGSEEAFAEQMTRKARALGMGRTIYRNASGLPDPEQVTTARDLTILARAIQDRFPKYYRYFQTRVFNYAGAAHRNHNKLLGRVEGVDGIKTGFTRASGFNLMTNARTSDRHIVAVVLGGRSGASRDQAMASLVRSNLPRAYAGVRQAPVMAETAERLRPTIVADASRSQERDVETTAATPNRPGLAISDTTSARRSGTPLDLAAMRPVFASAAGATSTTTPSALPLKAGLQAAPQSAQAYAAVPDPDSSDQPAPSGAGPSGNIKIQARLASLETLAFAKPEAATRSEPIKAEPVKAEAPKADTKSLSSGVNHERLQKTLSGWVIQLGATDDETKAKAILQQARSRSGRMLAKASAFTEKVVREGTTLYRARFSGFEANSAQQACKTLKRSGFNCFATRS